MELQIGSVVRSRSGRDKGLVLAVIGLAEGEYVYIANGKMRSIALPKRKKKLHLALLNECDERIAVLLDQRELTDHILRELLSAYDTEL